MTDLIFKEETYKIIGAAMDVYNEHSNGFPEPIYQESMEIELELRSILFNAQYRLPLYYKRRKLKKMFIPDLLCYEKIIVELKVLPAITDNERKQLIHYLKASNFTLGLLVNFGSPNKLEWERVVWSKEKNAIDYGF